MVAYVNDVILADGVAVADSFLTRLVGLLGKKNINKNEGLLLMNCTSVHCFFMKFTIDVIYLSKNMIVLDKETIHPWKVGKTVKKTFHILELAEGSAKIVSIGDSLVIGE